jgi:type IV pilus assembly protein PilX
MRNHCLRSHPGRTRERGTILIIALIVLVAMTLAGIATMRSVDTATIMAGNIGLRQAGSNAADQGIQAATAWIGANIGVPGGLDSDLHNTGTASNGYYSNVTGNEPDWRDKANWSEAAQLNGGAPDAAGNVVYFLIHRLCTLKTCPAGGTCAGIANPCASTISDATLSGSGADQTRPTDAHTTQPATHYRITARAEGPRNSVSIVQSLVKPIY